MAYCRNCGAEIELGGAKCPSCGYSEIDFTQTQKRVSYAVGSAWQYEEELRELKRTMRNNVVVGVVIFVALTAALVTTPSAADEPFTAALTGAALGLAFFFAPWVFRFVMDKIGSFVFILAPIAALATAIAFTPFVGWALFLWHCFKLWRASRNLKKCRSI